MEVTHGRVIDSLADNARSARSQEKEEEGDEEGDVSRDSLFTPFTSAVLSPLSLTGPPPLFLSFSFSFARTTRLRTYSRGDRGSPLCVRFSPHRFRFLPPHAMCLFLRLPLWFAPSYASLSLSLSSPPSHSFCSLALVYTCGRAGGRTDGATLPNTRLCCASDCLLPLSRSQTRRGWSKRGDTRS